MQILTHTWGGRREKQRKPERKKRNVRNTVSAQLGEWKATHSEHPDLFETVAILYSDTAGERQPKGVSISMNELGEQNAFLEMLGYLTEASNTIASLMQNKIRCGSYCGAAEDVGVRDFFFL